MYEYNENQNLNQTQNQQSQESAEALNKAAINAQKKVEKKKAKKKFWGKVGTGLGVGLAFGLMAGCAFVGITRTVDHFFPQDSAKAIERETEPEVDFKQNEKDILNDKIEDKNDDFEFNSPNDDFKNIEPLDDVARPQNRGSMDVSDIVEVSMPSIVSITNKSVQEIRSMFGMGIQQYESTSAGSGIIIGENNEELLIVTNDHVVENADTLSVGFVDDEVYTAYVKGTDSDIDLAVVAVKISDISDSTKSAIRASKIGDSNELKVGEQVVAIGNALGYGQSVTTGIVSALERDITDDDVDNPLIQTDAAINPGNSGGALYNMDGELIGINCAKIASTAIEGVGYAIPMDSAMPIIDALMSRKVREEVDAKDAGYIGISGVSVDLSTSKMYGIPVGVYIQNVEEGSPADEAGLVQGDVIRKFDGITVSSISDIRNNLDYYRAGETVDLDVYRMVDGEYNEMKMPITLGSRKGTSLDPDREKETENNNDEPHDESEESEEDNSNKHFYRNDDGSYVFRFGF